ncbi:hypothetical protein LP419_22430 [Massilia sp. H-1]|nr:hypothetical protein LP419_22430 [Massilia sp. H-1]
MLKIVLIVVIVLARRGGRRHAASVPSSGAGRRRSCVLKPRCPRSCHAHLQRVDFKELDHLPAPVQRYLRTVLKEGQPLVAGAGLRHTGSFNTGEEFAAWKPFQLGATGDDPASGLRLGWPHRHAARPDGARARRLCGGRGAPACGRARPDQRGGLARQGRPGRRRADAFSGRGRVVSDRLAAEPGRALGSDRCTVGARHPGRRRRPRGAGLPLQ